MIGVTILLAALLLCGVFILYVLSRCLEKLMDIEELLFHACAALGNIGAKLEEKGEAGKDAAPDAPDKDERSEEEKTAEKRFTEGVMNILNYESKRGMGS